MIRWVVLRAFGSAAAFAYLLAVAPAAEYRDTCDGDETSWVIPEPDANDAIVRLHGRNKKICREGAGAEQIVVEAQRYGTELSLFHKLPTGARVIPDLTATLWVRSDRPGARLYLRVIFPNQKDPKTGQVLSALVEGAKYQDVNRWQQLSCSTSDKTMQNEIRLLRARFQPESVDVRGGYVDQVCVVCPLAAGRTELFLDDLHVGPLVESSLPQLAEEGRRVVPTAEIRQGRLEVGKKPFLTVMMIDHGEPAALFKKLHANTILTPRADNRDRLVQLREQGLWAAADPRTLPAPDHQLSDGERGAPPPYQYPEILMWYLGTWITAQERDDVGTELEQLRRCDYEMRRPALADVLEDERYYSRYVSILGTSRHIFGTNFSIKDYREWLLQRSQIANAGSNLFTWIQVEAPPSTNRWRLAAGLKPAILEPELIRLQLYAAISAGFRGFGYWSRTSLEADVPGALERRLAIAQLNLELELLEPFLATANLDRSDLTFSVKDPARPLTRPDFDFVRDPQNRATEIKKKLNERDTRLKTKQLTPQETDAAVFQGPYYKLIIATWLAHDAQFVPGKLAGNDAKILIPEPSEVARFWQVTPTGVHELNKIKTAGFYQVTIPKFDQTAVILTSALPQLRYQVEQRVREMAPASARISIDLAKEKLKRVQAIDQELTALGQSQPDSAYLLASAGQLIARAENAVTQNEFDDARENAADAMQLLRVLQYAHWNEAMTQSGPRTITSLPTAKPESKAKPPATGKRSRGGKTSKPSPAPPPVVTLNNLMSSPYTICFETLPDHWRMISRIGRSADRPQENLLPCGDFEDPDSVQEHWSQSQNAVEGVRGDAHVAPQPHHGAYALRLVAVPVVKVDPPTVIPRPPLTVTSRPVPIRAGQILYIGGWINLPSPVAGSLDGVTISDNLEGMRGALRFRTPGGWQRFQMLRDVRADGEIWLTITLHGMGEVLVDDLQIIPHEERPIETLEATKPDLEPARPRSFGLWRPFANLGQQSAPQRPAVPPAQ